MTENAERIINFIRHKKSGFWSRERERRPIELFHLAAKRVPAYRDFLKRNRVDHEKIKTFKDFQLVPETDKKDYLRKYPLEMLCWDGSLEKQLVFTATSGSTGEPFYFPRWEKLDRESSVAHQLFLENGFRRGENGPVLVIVGFGMGVWIGGLITYKAFEIAGRRGGYPVSIITPGVNKQEIFHALKKLAPHYRQTILVGYPPFIKDIVDEAAGRNINLKKLNIRILTAAEPFTENFRDYLVKKSGVENPCLDTLNVYGTADIGTMAWETPTSILIRRLAIKNKKLFNDIFSPIEKTPTLCQYNPFFITFEAPEGEIILTGDNAIPLIRYSVGDHGGVFSFGEAVEKLKGRGFNFEKEARRAGIANYIYQLPFVYVYERKDFSAKLYGAVIYPEPIKETLRGRKLTKFITGKFKMMTKFSGKYNQFLEINIELKASVKPSKKLEIFCRDAIIKNLLRKNSEYRNNYSFMPREVTPRIVFWTYEHPLHFKPGVKQRWVEQFNQNGK